MTSQKRQASTIPKEDATIRLSPDIDQDWLEQFPLSTLGRFVVNNRGSRFRLCGVNWYGASDAKHVVGGLDVQSLEVICETVRLMGFSVVRLPFSNEMLRSHVPEGAIDFNLNPSLKGLTALQVFDEVVLGLGRHQVAVIINNHTTYGEWCGPPSKNSLWFDPGTPYTEERWLQDWTMLARRYSRLPFVVGYDLRNEIRPRWPLWPVWGPGAVSCRLWGPGCDWALAAREAADRLLAICPQALIVVERIVWPQSCLADYAKQGGALLPALSGRLVLGVHHYSWSGPGRFLPPWALPESYSVIDWALRSSGVVSPENYGDMSSSRLMSQIRSEWGFLLEENVCPVWVSEFGVDATRSDEMSWLRNFVAALEHYDADWAYWPLNVGPKPGDGSDEPYGLVDKDWTPKTHADDCRIRLLAKIGLNSRILPSVSSSLRHDLSVMNVYEAAWQDWDDWAVNAKDTEVKGHRKYSEGSTTASTKGDSPSLSGDSPSAVSSTRDQASLLWESPEVKNTRAFSEDGAPGCMPWTVKTRAISSP